MRRFDGKESRPTKDNGNMAFALKVLGYYAVLSKFLKRHKFLSSLLFWTPEIPFRYSITSY